MKFAFGKEDDVIAAFRNGKEWGFDHFFKTYYRSLVFFARRYVIELAVAEDMVAEVFVNVWNKREKIDSEEGLKGYLYQSVYHASLRWLERESKRDSIHNQFITESTAGSENADQLENMIRAETIRQVREAISTLPGQCRKVFEKIYIEGKSVRETASELNLSITNVKNQKARGLKLLRNRIDGSTLLFISFLLN
jgi:RNA polymerase sigma-70 factor (family 1)